MLLTQGLEVPWEAAHCCWTERCSAETFCPKEQEDTRKEPREALHCACTAPGGYTAWAARGFDRGEMGVQLSLRHGRWFLQECFSHRIKTGTALFCAWFGAPLPNPRGSGRRCPQPGGRGIIRRFLTAQLLIPNRAAVVLCTAVDSSPGSLWAPVCATKASVSCLHPAPRRVGAPLAWLSR